MLPMQPGDVPETFVDVDDLMHDVGFKPDISIEDGIRHFVAWYRGSPSTASASPAPTKAGAGAGIVEQAGLVVVVESPVSEQRMHDMFEAMNVVLLTHPEVGTYNQTISAKTVPGMAIG